jgi:hypothetical protein
MKFLVISNYWQLVSTRPKNIIIVIARGSLSLFYGENMGGVFFHGGSPKTHGCFNTKNSLMTWMIWRYPHDVGNLHI